MLSGLSTLFAKWLKSSEGTALIFFKKGLPFYNLTYFVGDVTFKTYLSYSNYACFLVRFTLLLPVQKFYKKVQTEKPFSGFSFLG